MKTPTNHIDGALEVQASGVLSKLPKPVQGLMAATIGAATLAVSPEVQSATTVTMSTPTLVSGTQEMWAGQSGMSRIDSFKEIPETRSNLQIHVSNPSPNSIIFTVSGFLGSSTGNSTKSGVAGLVADVNAELLGQVDALPTISLAQLDGPAFMNVGTDAFNSPGEGFNVTQPFSYSWTLPTGESDINLSLLGHASNSFSSVSLSGNGNVNTPTSLNWSSQPIPEAETAILGALGTLLLLQRRRKEEQSK